MDSACEFIVCASPLPLPSILSFLNSPCLNSPWRRGPIPGLGLLTGGGAKIRRSGRLNSSIAMRSLRSSSGRMDCISIFPSSSAKSGKVCIFVPHRVQPRASRFGSCASLSRRPQELRPEVFPAIERHDCKSCPSRFTSRSAGHCRGASSDHAPFSRKQDQLEAETVLAKSGRQRDASAGIIAIMSLVLALWLTDNGAIRGASDGDRSQVFTHERAQTDP
jgi:hypothetical protein